MIVTLLKLGLLLLSYLGWWEFFRGRCRMNVYFVPAFTIAAQFTVLFLPGLLNFLPEAAWALYLGGFLLLADALRREKLGFAKHYVNFGYLIFFAFLAVLALTFRGRVLTWFDNFTHWATAVKNMLSADRFPTFAQSAVTFQTYPLGGTAMIWYFSRFTSDQEDFWMLAQGFMMLCMLLPLFAWGKKGPLSALFLAAAGNFLLCYNTPLTDLLVDTLLPLAGTALLLLLHRECLRKEDPLDIRYFIVFAFWVMNIKNAGTLYVLAGLVIALWRLKKGGASLRPLLLGALLLLAGWMLWERHCDYVFYNNAISQHEISLEYFQVHLGEKTPGDMLTIIGLVARDMVLRRELLWVWTAAAVLGLATWVLAPEKKRDFSCLILFFLVSFLVYAISLMAMYVTSMSLEAALELQSADRYFRIWEITAFFLLAVYGIALTEHLSHAAPVSLALTAATVLLTFGCYGSFQHIGQVRNYELQRRIRAEAPIDEYGVAPGYSYLICDQDERVWFPAFFWMYRMDTNQVAQVRVTGDELTELEKHYDYIVILDEGNPAIEAWVADTYPEQAGKTVIQCFK